MRKKHKKVPVTTQHSAPQLVSHSAKITQASISSFHTLLKRRAQLENQISHLSESTADHAGRLEDLRSQLSSTDQAMDAMGGLPAYQRASKLGQSAERGGDSSRVLIAWLKELGYNTTGSKLRMLELGALAHDNYKSTTAWIHNVPIDLHSQHPDILQQDFFQRPLPQSDDEAFDVVSCSLVLNYVSVPEDRGRMLQLIHQHLRPAESSLLYLVLPMPCVANSRYVNAEMLQSLLAVLGYELLKTKMRDGGRLAYWLWAWRKTSVDRVNERWSRKHVVVEGSKLNNFAILVPA